MARTKRVRLMEKHESGAPSDLETIVKKKIRMTPPGSGDYAATSDDAASVERKSGSSRTTSGKGPRPVENPGVPATYFQQTPFNRLCRAISDKVSKECAYETESFRWSSEALCIIRDVTETYITELFSKAKEFSDHAEKKETVRLKDFELAVKNDAGNPFVYEDMLASRAEEGARGASKKEVLNKRAPEDVKKKLLNKVAPEKAKKEVPNNGAPEKVKNSKRKKRPDE